MEKTSNTPISIHEISFDMPYKVINGTDLLEENSIIVISSKDKCLYMLGNHINLVFEKDEYSDKNIEGATVIQSFEYVFLNDEDGQIIKRDKIKMW